jgi:hypothetical protein
MGQQSKARLRPMYVDTPCLSSKSTGWTQQVLNEPGAMVQKTSSLGTETSGYVVLAEVGSLEAASSPLAGADVEAPHPAAASNVPDMKVSQVFSNWVQSMDPERARGLTSKAPSSPTTEHHPPRFVGRVHGAAAVKVDSVSKSQRACMLSAVHASPRNSKHALCPVHVLV